MKHVCPELVAEAVYGLPEVNRAQIKKARIVANPGCYPTAVQLGFLPLLKNKITDLDHLIADAKSGVSGAGRKAELHLLFPEAADNFKAYGVSGHRHLPEIVQGLSAVAGRDVRLVFVPHLTPMIRGIHATLYAGLTGDLDLQALYEKHYADEPFVDVLPAGSHPDTRSVRGANVCRIAVHRPQHANESGDIAVILSVIDNLTKGAAGQAVQNMNLMCGLPETAGLEQIALIP
jgi:N-acetyl-gamma-glutamyl-phosphate reductase